MITENRWEVVDRLMNGIWNSDEWNQLQTTNPRIKKANVELYTLLDSIKETIGWEAYLEIEESVSIIEAVMAETGILYGIHVANSIQLAAADPTQYSAHMLELEKT